MSEGGEEDTALAQPLLAPIDCLPPSASCGAVEALPLVHQQEQRPSSPRWQPPGTRYYEAYLHMAAWLGVLFVGYGVQCVASLLGLPDDGVHKVGDEQWHPFACGAFRLKLPCPLVACRQTTLRSSQMPPLSCCGERCWAGSAA